MGRAPGWSQHTWAVGVGRLRGGWCQPMHGMPHLAKPACTLQPLLHVFCEARRVACVGAGAICTGGRAGGCVCRSQPPQMRACMRAGTSACQ